MEIVKYRGKEIKISTEENAQSPDDWKDESCFLVYDHRQFTVRREGYEPSEINLHFANKKQKLYEGFYCFTVYAYIHSGVALSVKQDNNFPDKQWDVSTTGYILVKKEQGSNSRPKAFLLAQGLCELWNSYLSGEVYSYEYNGDTCGGYYGDDGKKQIMEEVQYEIDREVNTKFKTTKNKPFTTFKNDLEGKISYGVYEQATGKTADVKPTYNEAVDRAIELSNPTPEEVCLKESDLTEDEKVWNLISKASFVAILTDFAVALGYVCLTNKINWYLVGFACLFYIILIVSFIKYHRATYED